MRVLPRFIQVVVFTVCSILLLALSFSTPIKASAYSETPYMSPNFAPGVEPNMHNFMQGFFIELISSGTCLLVGIDPLTPTKQCLGINATTGKIGYVQNDKGLIGLVSSSTDFFYKTPPAHTKDYISYIQSHFGFAPHAYADQGVGFLGITPLINVWVTMRNLAYMFAILAFVGIGFAIMLRVKIDPRTVMTIQNMIPKVIIGLVLITFSYAIAGVMIDAMYASVYVVYNIYQSVPGISPDKTANLLQNNTPLGVVNQLGDNKTNQELHLPANGNIWGPFGIPENAAGLSRVGWAGALGLGKTFTQLLGIPTGPNKNLFGNDVLNAITQSGVADFATTANKPAMEVYAGLILTNDVFHLDIINAAIDGATWWLDEKITPLVKDGINNIPGLGRVFNFAFNFPILGAIPSSMTDGLIFRELYDAIQGGLRQAVPILIAWIIIFFALLISMIRLFFALLQCWVQTLFYIALGPLFILFGFIPKSKTGFGSWLRGLTANLLVFPITAAILLFGDVFVQEFSSGSGATNYYIPPLLGGIQLFIGPILAIGVFFIAANGPAIAKGLVGHKEDKNTGGAFGIAMGSGIKVITQTGKSMSEYTAPVPGGAPGQKQGWRGITRTLLH